MLQDYKIKEYMDIAFSEAEKALKIGEVPVGCVIVYKNKIIASGHNLVNKMSNPLLHAEIVALKRINDEILSENLNDSGISNIFFEKPIKEMENNIVNIGVEIASNVNIINYMKNENITTDLNEKKVDRIKHQYLEGNNAIHNISEKIESANTNCFDQLENIEDQTLHVFVNLEPCGMCLALLDKIKNCIYYYGSKNFIFGGFTVLNLNSSQENSNYIRNNFIDDHGRSIELLKQFYKTENSFAPDELRKKKN